MLISDNTAVTSTCAGLTPRQLEQPGLVIQIDFPSRAPVHAKRPLELPRSSACRSIALMGAKPVPPTISSAGSSLSR